MYLHSANYSTAPDRCAEKETIALSYVPPPHPTPVSSFVRTVNLESRVLYSNYAALSRVYNLQLRKYEFPNVRSNRQVVME